MSTKQISSLHLVIMTSIAGCLTFEQQLKAVSDSARLDVELFLQHVLKKNRAYLYAWPEKTLSETQLSEFESCIQRRKQGEPVAYIIGSQGFWSLDLNVNSSTLIPRPETELLVELALEHCGSESRILDLGTGTGAIALAVATEFPSADIHAVDFSEDAVALAKKNAEKNKLNRVNIYQSHWFENVDGYFDVIMSNPPYIEENDPHLSQGDVRFEPRSALVSGQDGMNDIRIICREAKKHFFDSGVLMFEHGWNQGELARQELARNGYNDIETFQDFGGRERVTFGRV